VNRFKQLADRRAFLIAHSELQRERIALSGEAIRHFFCEGNWGRLLKSPTRTVAGLLIVRWIAKKLSGLVAGRFVHQAIQVTSALWRRLRRH
jgi:hypothetical protein